MDAIVYTRNDDEYDLIKTTLENEAGLIDVDRHPLNGHKRFDHGYDVAVVALKGAEGMEVMLEYVSRFPDTNIIFAGIAIRNHIYDFIERPYSKERLKHSIHDVIERCPNRNRWVLP